jgi:hypothetical protein
MERKKPVFERDTGHSTEEEETNVIGRLIADTFRPTESQRKAKAALLAFLADPETMLFDLKSLTVDRAISLTGIPALRTWWNQPGFRAWFINKEESRQKIKYLTDKALESAVQILDDPDPRASSAKVSILKILLTYEAQEQTAKTNTKFDNMDINQLRGFLKQNAHLIRPLLDEEKPANLSEALEESLDATNITDKIDS